MQISMMSYPPPFQTKGCYTHCAYTQATPIWASTSSWLKFYTKEHQNILFLVLHFLHSVISLFCSSLTVKKGYMYWKINNTPLRDKPHIKYHMVLTTLESNNGIISICNCKEQYSYLIPFDQTCLLRLVSIRMSGVPIIFSANFFISLIALGARLLNPLLKIQTKLLNCFPIKSLALKTSKIQPINEHVFMFVIYMQSTVNNYSTSATGYKMTDSERGAIVAIIMSYPTNTTEVISYTMGKPINTCECHYVIWTTLYISCFYYQALI